MPTCSPTTPITSSSSTTRCGSSGQFDPTGSTLDNAVYANFETAKKVIVSCARDSASIRRSKPTASSHSVMVVADTTPRPWPQIRQQVPGVSVATSAARQRHRQSHGCDIAHGHHPHRGCAGRLGLLLITLMFVHDDRRAQENSPPLIAAGAPPSDLIIIREALAVNALGGVNESSSGVTPRPSPDSCARAWRIPRPVAADSGVARAGRARVGRPHVALVSSWIAGCGT